MKKLFAILSVLALTFAIVGLTKVSAEEKFVEDPTITENDIPVYIMGSIMSTFPNNYDNEAEPDGNWQGAARQYPWNETRLKVRQLSESGFTGKNYLVYFAGALSASDSHTGNNILLFTAADNEYGFYMSRYDGGAGSYTATYDGVTFNYKQNQGPMDGSLSHAVLNVSGKDVEAEMNTFASVTGGSGVNSWGNQVYNRAMVFDASGRAIWGNGTDTMYATAEAPNETVLPAEYCYVNGVATRFTDVNACDKALTPVLDEEGVPVLDEVTGEAKMQEGTDPDYVKGRYVWMWVSNEDWESTYKERTNTVDYLANGWDPEKWDDEYECDGGHMLIAFVNAAQSKFAINDAQAAAANAALVGTADEGKYSAGYLRKYVALIKIPAGGIIFDFGYLDKGTVAEESFSEFMLQGYKYGRTLDADGKGVASMTTYNFSAKPIYQNDVVVDGYSQQYLEGTQTIEIVKGQKITPAKNVVYSGLGKYWSVENSIVSYSSDTSKLNLTITTNGITAVEPNTGYNSFKELADDFIADLTAFKGKAPDMTDEKTFHSYMGWGGFVATNAGNATVGGSYTTAFMNNPEMYAKWHWILERIYLQLLQYPGDNGNYTAVLNHYANAKDNNWAASPESMHKGLYFFLTGTNSSAWGVNFGDGHNSEWMDLRTNIEKWNSYEIDTTEDQVDKVYNVAFKVENPDTGNVSNYAIKYVVVDEYTPIIKLAKANYLKFTPIVAENGSMTFKGANGTAETIDPAQFATAYNARYNGVTILGDDISSRIHYTSATLDFDAPTEGEHKVTAKVYNGVKYAEKTFTVKVEDVTAPTAAVVEKVTVQYGSLFNPYDLIQYAFDNVDGNLLNVKGAVSVASSVNTTKPKEYTVTFTFSDEAGNYVEKTSKVTVAENPEEKVAELKEAIEAQQAKINALNDEIAEVKAQAEAIAAQTAGCGASSGAIMAGFFAMASLLVVVLKKRH